MKNFAEILEVEVNNRKKAIAWLEGITESLKEVVLEVYGNMDGDPDFDNHAMSIWHEEERGGKIHKVYTQVYFRYGDHYGENDTEGPGFYATSSCYPNSHLWWGTPIENLRGRDFWSRIRGIKEWIPLLKGDIRLRVESRKNVVDAL